MSAHPNPLRKAIPIMLLVTPSDYLQRRLRERDAAGDALAMAEKALNLARGDKEVADILYKDAIGEYLRANQKAVAQ